MTHGELSDIIRFSALPWRTLGSSLTQPCIVDTKVGVGIQSANIHVSAH